MTQTDFMIGYGSILSRFSRETYSGIAGEAQRVSLTGWRRSWTTRYRDEGATYLGIRADEAARLNGVLVPVKISPELRERERGYAWTQVDPAQLASEDALPEGRYWVVVNHAHAPADENHPVPQTYVDTCLIGCLETGGEALARDFIQSTDAWEAWWLNDRDHPAPLYPRLARAATRERAQIDALLDEAGILKHRRSL